jgi:electron-transferring-flavoprotein dehydrogenase
MRSGMAAAEHFVAKGSSEGWDAQFHTTDTAKELHKVRNIRPGFQKGLWRGLINAGIQTVTMGMLPGNKKNHADHTELKKLEEYPELNRNWVERDLPPRDRLASVYFAATEHDEDQPIHLHVSDTNICIDQCTKEYGNPCTRFCPAGVYEMVEEDGDRRLQINSANCVHCKTCDIKDPYQIINWVTPEGGSGPNYNNL